jgi:hypothetical protein
MSCHPRRATSKSFAEACWTQPAAMGMNWSSRRAAGASGVAADRYGRGARSSDFQASRPVVRPDVGRACGHHAASRTDRRPSAEPRRRGAIVLLRPGAAHAAGPTACHTRAAATGGGDLRSQRPRGRSGDPPAGIGLPQGCAGLRLSVDLADASVVDALLAGVSVSAPVLADLHAALATKDSTELASLSRGLPASTREGLLALAQLYGDEKVLDEAREALKSTPGNRPGAVEPEMVGQPARRRPGHLRSCRPARLCLLQRSPVSRSTRVARATRWCAGAAMTGWAQSSDTTTTGPSGCRFQP